MALLSPSGLMTSEDQQRHDATISAYSVTGLVWLLFFPSLDETQNGVRRGGEGLCSRRAQWLIRLSWVFVFRSKWRLQNGKISVIDTRFQDQCHISQIDPAPDTQLQLLTATNVLQVA